MRIISKFKDFYDVVQDPSGKVWERESFFTPIPLIASYDNYRMQSLMKDFNSLLIINKTKSNPLTIKQQEYLSNLYHNTPYKTHKRYSYNPIEQIFFVLNICGKLYYFVKIIDKGKVKVYQFEEYRELYQQKERDFFYGRMTYDNWFQFYSNNTRTNKDILITLNTPLLILESDILNNRGQLLINPRLSNYNLQKIFNPYELYQEIDMFINNDMVKQENSDINMTDELKRDSKGMDEWSFKQIGPKQRKRKKI